MLSFEDSLLLNSHTLRIEGEGTVHINGGLVRDGGSLAISDGVTVVIVPEPSSLVLLLGLLAAAAGGRRRFLALA